MQVRSDRRYAFAVEPPALWSAIGTTGEFRRWWPWLRSFDGEGLVAGGTWHCAVQPPLPYILRFAVTVDEVDEARFVRATVGGDIVGTATLEITATDGGSEARLASALAPANRLLRTFAAAAGPLVRFGHDWVLDTGARQFTARAL